MKKTLKKTLSIIIAILMIATTMPFAFAADANLVINMTDSYGDGWNGNAIQVGTVSGGVFTKIADATVNDGNAATYEAVLSDESAYAFRWTKDYYAEECSFSILIDGDTVFEVSDCSGYADGELLYIWCEHNFTDSFCSICGLTCGVDFAHTIDSDGKCSVCGYICDHNYTNHYCKTCGYAENGYSVGYCGANNSNDVIWSLDTNGLLTISGTGDMKNYTYTTSPYYNNSDITTVVIEDGVTSIGNCAFYYCTSLESIEIPDSVTSIGEAAFKTCTRLESVTIPDSVTSIGDGAFNYCTSLENITVDEDNEYYSSDEYGVLFDKDKTTLIQYPVGNSRTSYTIPDSVTSIGDFAFCNSRSLASVTIPDSVTSIGDDAFSSTAYYNDENNWENGVLYIGNHLIKAKEDISGNYSVKPGTKTIADYAFCWCESLESVTIPDSVTSIGDSAFYDCRSLVSVTIPDSVTSIGDSAFYDCRSLVSVTIPDSVTSINNSAFCYCSSLASVTIPDSVTSIGSYAFDYCTSLASVTIPDSVTSIGSYAFDYCTSLESIIIPAGVTSINNSAFCYCSSLASVTIPDSVTSIGKSAFLGCTSLASIEIPDSVTSIVDWAFYNCTSLTLVHYLGTSEQWDGIEIGSYGNDELTGATRHYCTEVTAATVTCTEDGKTAGWYCADCEEDIVTPKEAAALGHDYDVVKSEDNLTRPTQNDDGTWEDGYYTYTCKNGCGTPTTETVQRADYTAVETAIASIPEDLSIYKKAAVEALNDAVNGVVYDRLITEQEEVNTMAKNIEDAITALNDSVTVDGFLTLKAQTNSSGSQLRFITTIDTLAYKEVGFVITNADDPTQTTRKTSKTVYTSIVAGGETLTAADISGDEDMNYILTFTITGITAETQSTRYIVKPFVVTLEGETIYGTENTFCVADMIA